MPVPKEAFSIEGGCNCQAVRYKVDVPAAACRPFREKSETVQHIQGKHSLPFIETDHCNHCRRATGSILSCYFTADISMLSMRLTPQSDSSQQPASAGEGREDKDWVPASEILSLDTPKVENTSFVLYASSEGARRTFCGKCGTPLIFWEPPTEKDWAEMVDIFLGTIDREYLEKYQLSPERQVFWDVGIDWIKKFSTHGFHGLPQHWQSELGTLIE